MKVVDGVERIRSFGIRAVCSLVLVLLCFERLNEAILSTVTRLSGLQLDSGFWAMGIAAGAMFGLSIWAATFLQRSDLFKNMKQREVLLPSVVFLAFFLLQLVRRPFALPFWDDYYGYYEWMLNRQPHTTWRSYFDSYLECKTSVSRLIAVAVYSVAGYRFIIATKALNLILLATCCWLMSSEQQEAKKKTMVFWISGILLFNLQQFYNLLCAFSGTTYYLTVLWGLLAFRYQTRKNTFDLLMTATFGILAAFTFGNGWIILPLTAALYLRERRYAAATTLFSLMMLAAWWYFHDYRPQRLNPLDRFEWTQYLLYSVSFLGGSAQFHDYFLLPMAMGLALLVFVFAASLRLLKWTSLPPGWALLVYMVGTAFMAGLFRHQNGFQQSLSLRYGFFSATALAAAASILIHRMHEFQLNHYRKALIGSAIGFTLLKAIFFYPEMAIAQIENHRMIRNWLLAGVPIEKRTAFYPEGTTALLKKAEFSGIWEKSISDTLRVNSNVFTIGYLSPSSTQSDP